MSKTKPKPNWIKAHSSHHLGGQAAQNCPRVHFASKNDTRSNKPRRMISLPQMRQQPTWNDILTKKHRGWGYVPSSYLHRSERLGRAGKPNSPHVKTCSNASFWVAAFAGA